MSATITPVVAAAGTAAAAAATTTASTGQRWRSTLGTWGRALTGDPPLTAWRAAPHKFYPIVQQHLTAVV